ncbi:hypothetical protein V2G26_003390 [Clonostachys chloroleuca]
MRAPGPLLEANWIASSKFRITLAAFLTLPTVASRVPPVFQQIVHQKYHVIHHTTNSKIQCNYSSVKIQSDRQSHMLHLCLPLQPHRGSLPCLSPLDPSYRGENLQKISMLPKIH